MIMNGCSKLDVAGENIRHSDNNPGTDHLVEDNNPDAMLA